MELTDAVAPVESATQLTDIGSCREPDAINAQLRENLADDDLSELLVELLFGVYPNRDVLHTAVQMFGAKRDAACDTGVGFFHTK